MGKWYESNITVKNLISMLSKFNSDFKVEVGDYAGIAKLVVNNEFVVLSEDGILDFNDD